MLEKRAAIRLHLVEAVSESWSNVFSLDIIWALMFLNEERRLGWGREEGGAERRENKRKVEANPKHCEKVMCFDMSN